MRDQVPQEVPQAFCINNPPEQEPGGNTIKHFFFVIDATEK
jgi:hypothetical protein